MNDKQVAELFIEQHVLQPSQADDVLNEVTMNGKSIAQAMVDSGFVDEHGFYQTIATALGTDFVDLSDREIPATVVKLIPSGLARLHRALPIEMQRNTLRVALAGIETRNLLLKMNDQQIGTISNLPNTSVIHRDSDRGYWQEVPVHFNASVMKQGKNVLKLIVPAGIVMSGVEYDYLRLELDDSK